jgi:hypothetical protein
MTVTALIIVAFAGAASSAEPQVTARQIVDAWSARQSAARSFRFVWVESVTMPKGSMMTPDWPASMNPRKLYVPPETSVVDRTYTVVVDGDKRRTERDGVAVSREDQLFRSEHVVAFDGEILKGYMTSPPGSHPTGAVSAGKDGSALEVYLYPVYMTFRPFHRVMGEFDKQEMLDPARFAVDSRRVPIGGRPCILLNELPGTAKPSTRSLWLDPERDFVVMRYVQRQGEIVQFQIDIREHRREAPAWVPMAWKMVIFQGVGRMVESMTAKVRDHAVNPAIDPRAFDVDFPPGTWVEDLRAGTTVPESIYIVQSGGKRRPVTLAEARVYTYEELFNSEPGMARKGGGMSRYRVTLAIAGALATVALLWLAVRRRKKTATG